MLDKEIFNDQGNDQLELRKTLFELALIHHKNQPTGWKPDIHTIIYKPEYAGPSRGTLTSSKARKIIEGLLKES